MQTSEEGATRFLVNRKGEAYEFLVDDIDAEEVAAWAPWCLIACRGKLYVGRDHRGAPGPRTVLLHRQLLQPASGFEVDHINGDTLDNRRNNLRILTHSQQLQNRGMEVRNTSGFRGVCIDKRRNKWIASIKVSGKYMLLGSFATPIEAARVARNARALLFPYAVESRHPVEVER